MKFIQATLGIPIVLLIVGSLGGCAQPAADDSPLLSFDYYYSPGYTTLDDVTDVQLRRDGDVARKRDGHGRDRGRYCDADPAIWSELEAVIEKHDLRSWDGFDRDDRDALDASSFNLGYLQESGEEVTAAGYFLEPSGFKNANKELVELLERHKCSGPVIAGEKVGLTQKLG